MGGDGEGFMTEVGNLFWEERMEGIKSKHSVSAYACMFSYTHTLACVCVCVCVCVSFLSSYPRLALAGDSNPASVYSADLFLSSKACFFSLIFNVLYLRERV